VKNRCEELGAGGVVQACCGDSLAWAAAWPGRRGSGWAGGHWWVGGGGWVAVRQQVVGDVA
jgi:hypothetical protein